MDAGGFDVLEDAADIEAFAVGDRIQIVFEGVFEELVDEYRGFGADGGAASEEFFQVFVVVGDEHAPASEDEGWAQQNGEADLMGAFVHFLSCAGHPVLRLPQAKFAYQCGEQASILGGVDTFQRRADDVRPAVSEC